MRKFTGTALVAGIMLIGPGCSGELLGDVERDPGIEAEALASDECEALTDQMLPGDFSLPEGANGAGTLYEQTQRDIEGARKLAIDDEIEQAGREYEALVHLLGNEGAEGDTARFSQAEAEEVGKEVLRFLADPEGAQTALKAVCSAYAGGVVTAEELLDTIDKPETRRAYEDDVEFWQMKTAEDRAINEAYHAAYEVLPLIDDETPEVTQQLVLENIEYWIMLNAERAARNGNPERAREIVSQIQNSNPAAQAAARERVEQIIADTA